MSILRGFKKLLKNENSGLSKSRLEICNDCEYRKGIICGVCGCYLKAKSRDENENCPKDKWTYIDQFYKVHPLKIETFSKKITE